MSSSPLSQLIEVIVSRVTRKLEMRLKVQQTSLVDRHAALLNSRGEIPDNHTCVGFILQNAYITPYPQSLLRNAPAQYRVPIVPSLLTEAIAWKRRETQYGNDAGILHQSLRTLADNTDELVQYLPNVARTLLDHPAQDEDALYSRLHNRQQRAFRTVQSKIVMFQADDLLS